MISGATRVAPEKAVFRPALLRQSMPGFTEKHMTIKPIETKYNGYRFRSRLEARWAVFFDSMEIAYEYELQGFDLGQGRRYLPDFYLPDFGLHVEIKPARDVIDEQFVFKISSFAIEHGNSTLLVVGTPGNEEMFLVDRKLEGWGAGSAEPEVPTMVSFWESVCDWAAVTIMPTPHPFKRWALAYRNPQPLWQADWSRAVALARGARFEHGESPKAPGDG